MSGAPRVGSYVALLTSSPSLRRTFGLALLGRFGYALLPLCLLFAVADATDFTLAAFTSAVWGLCGLAMPVQARLIDRFGQRAVLPLAATLASGSLLTMLPAFHRHAGHPAAWITPAMMLGLFSPALGPSMRAQWRVGTSTDDRPTAYSLDAVAEEVIFVLGPLAAAALSARALPWAGMAVTAALLPVGAGALAVSPYRPEAAGSIVKPAVGEAAADVAASGCPGRPVRRHGPLERPRMRALLAAVAVSAASGSVLMTWVSAMADSEHRQDVMGLFEAAMGVVSIAAGLAWGRLRPAGGWPRHMTALLWGRVPVLAACLLAPTLWGLGAAMVVQGALSAPGFIVAFLASDAENPEEQHTEASTWLTVAGNLGSSAGTATGGWTHAHLELWQVVTAVTVVLVATALPLTRSLRGPGAGRRAPRW